MEIVRANKYRLYPTAKQKALLHEMFGVSRFVFNNILGKIQNGNYGLHIIKSGKNKNKECNRIPSQTELVGSSTSLKQEYSFVSRVPNDYIQASLSNLYSGCRGFYRGGGYPKFKSKKAPIQSINMKAGSRVKIKDNYIQLNKSTNSPYSKDDHLIRFKKHKTNHKIGKITGFTISKDNLNRYWISITSKIEFNSKRIKTGKEVGIDLGIKDLLICSDGTVVPNDHLTKKSEFELTKYQRRLSKKKRGSKNRNKARLKVSKIHDKIKNQRNYRNHNISKNLINIYDFISLESLQVKNMVQNRRLSKAISDVAWGDLVQKIQYKANENQVTIIRINKFYPSSKSCSRCGSVKKELSLSERTYTCTECGLVLDRDINASINILNEGLRLTG